jgi:hypothetical protein
MSTQGFAMESIRMNLLAYIALNQWRGLTYPVLVKGSSSALKIKITNSFSPIVNGIPKAAVTTAEYALAVPTGYAPGYAGAEFIPAGSSTPKTGGIASPWPTSYVALGKSQWIRYLVVCDGTNVFALPSFIGDLTAAPDAPPVPVGYLVLGDVTTKTDSTHTFTPNTDAFDATGVTSVFRDLIWPDTGPSAIKPLTTLAPLQ